MLYSKKESRDRGLGGPQKRFGPFEGEKKTSWPCQDSNLVSTPRNVVNLTIFPPDKYCNKIWITSYRCAEILMLSSVWIRLVRVGTRVHFLRACSYAPFSVTALSLITTLMQHTMNFSLQIFLHISHRHISGLYFIITKAPLGAYAIATTAPLLPRR